MSSIVNQNTYASVLPDFRNLGVVLRILVAANAIALSAAVVQTTSLRALPADLVEVFAVVQPLLVLSVIALMLLRDVLRRLAYPAGLAAVLALVLGLTVALYSAAGFLLAPGSAPLWRYLVLVALTTALLLGYFNLRGRALSPALTEARLQALQARIRPHFLFNSLNAVLSLIRQDPRRAETALEDLADLFRVLMADSRSFTPIAREVALCQQYLGIEQLRLGERLRVEWHIERMPQDALIPPFVLQPLLENAVYHGIEPRTEPGVVRIEIGVERDELIVTLRNPYAPDSTHHSGNRMALDNIRERLQLHFDAEASLTAKAGATEYEVRIVLPYSAARGTRAGS